MGNLRFTVPSPCGRPVWAGLLASLMLLGGLSQLASFGQGTPAPADTSLGQVIGNVEFSADGKTVRLHDLKDARAVVVVFLSFNCPISNSCLAALHSLSRDYAARGVTLVGVCPGAADAREAARQAREFKVPFLVCADPNGTLVDAFQAAVTPEAFVLDGQEFRVRYRGRVDDEYADRLKRNLRISRHDLKEAVDQLLAGKTVTTPRTIAVGCRISREQRNKAATGAVTYYRDVLPILQQHCQGCHRPGQVGPFSLLTYEQAVDWAGDIKDFTRSRRMPPWKPTEAVPMHQERRLSAAELATLAAWADQGTPAGDPADAPPPRTFSSGWQLGQPDLVLRMPSEFQLGPHGDDIQRGFVLPTGLTEDKYVAAVEVRPGNARIVHHITPQIDCTGRTRQLEQEEQRQPRPAAAGDRGPGYRQSAEGDFLPSGLLAGWVPGQIPRFLPAGTGYLVPKGSDLVLSIHYHRNGRLETDQTEVGLYFVKEPGARPYQNVVLESRFTAIPAGVEDFVATATGRVLADCQLHSVWLHMHMLGQRMKVTLTPPGGEPRTLIHIAEWDYNWQETYFFQEPVRVSAGTLLHVEAHYDNSVRNPVNPHRPPQAVRYGEQTTDEMCFVFFGATAARAGQIPFENVDDRAWNCLQPYRFRSPLLDACAAALHLLGELPVLGGLGLVLIGVLLVRRQALSAAVVCITLLGAKLAGEFVAVAGGRLTAEAGALTPVQPLLDAATFLATATFVTVASVLAGGWSSRRWAALVLAALFLACLVGLAQLYAGATVQAGPVVSGWFAGLVWGACGSWLARRPSTFAGGTGAAPAPAL